MDTHSLSAVLHDLPLGGWRFFPVIGSTNDEALAWSQANAPDLALVIADAQTRGRGRRGRRWLTPPGQALAVSLVLRPSRNAAWTHYVGLAALSLHEALRTWHIATRIKWPNDVLLDGEKIAGILVEAIWEGDQPQAVIIGMGVNITQQAVPPKDTVDFPASSLEAVRTPPPRREDVLRAWLQALIRWRAALNTPGFIAAWQQALIWRGECVRVETPHRVRRGRLLGLNPQGCLQISTAEGGIETISHLEGHLRPCNL